MNEHTRLKPLDQEEAFNILRSGFTIARGVIRPKNESYQPTEIELAAVRYLCAEWDYADEWGEKS